MKIKSVYPDHVDHLRDESRLAGAADSISFPENEKDVINILKEMYSSSTPVTVQGSRTGLSGGAVPLSGHMLNMKKMDRVLEVSRSDDKIKLSVQPGLLLSSLEEYLQNGDLNRYFFPPDPTETTACIGGVTACNSSGAASYRYGPARRYINRLRVVLADGSVVDIKRGREKASGRSFSLYTENMKHLCGKVPAYLMPDVKNSAGYFAADDMDMIDIFIGSEGTLGVITEVDLILQKRPSFTWGMFIILPSESVAVSFTKTLRKKGLPLMSIEYFDKFSMDLVRTYIPCREGTYGIYTQLFGDDEDDLMRTMLKIAELAAGYDVNEDDIFTACEESRIEIFKKARHCVPEGINLLIDETRKIHPDVTKLASDIAVPRARLRDMMNIYLSDLSKTSLTHAIFGHIGDNHLHVNIAPKNPSEYLAGKALIRSWCENAVLLGGTISAEHGTGKLKKEYLRIMYNDNDINQMKALKMVFDKKNILGRGNIF